MTAVTVALDNRPVTIDLDALASTAGLRLAATGDLNDWAAHVAAHPLEAPVGRLDVAVLALRVALVAAALSHAPRRARRRLRKWAAQ